MIQNDLEFLSNRRQSSLKSQNNNKCLKLWKNFANLLNLRIRLSKWYDWEIWSPSSLLSEPSSSRLALLYVVSLAFCGSQVAFTVPFTMLAYPIKLIQCLFISLSNHVLWSLNSHDAVGFRPKSTFRMRSLFWSPTKNIP